MENRHLTSLISPSLSAVRGCVMKTQRCCQGDPLFPGLMSGVFVCVLGFRLKLFITLYYEFTSWHR